MGILEEEKLHKNEPETTHNQKPIRIFGRERPTKIKSIINDLSNNLPEIKTENGNLTVAEVLDSMYKDKEK